SPNIFLSCLTEKTAGIIYLGLIVYVFEDRVLEMYKLCRKGVLTIAFLMVFMAPASAVITGVNTISRGRGCLHWGGRP
ncbi:MAG TPA: hypothetical protein PK277_00565, partial [Methanoregulaceae archaeon]|nr:hypothetical protein [Methanoregulaceae archaeon]